MKNIIRALGLLFLLCFLIHILNNKFFSYSPIGKLLNPFHGYISTDSNIDSQINLKNLNHPVEVIWDENNIPHIFAQDDHDLYMTQGYVVAQDRLWQMDFITRFHEGRLSEIIGYNADILNSDRFMRTIGIVEGAKASLSTIAGCYHEENGHDNKWNGLENCPADYTLEIHEQDIYNMLISYSKGVNQYLESLNWDELPIEYKILDYEPELWTPFKTCVLLKAMTLDLTGRNSDVIYQFIKQEYDDKAKFLYPEVPYNNNPIIEKFKIDSENIENKCAPINETKKYNLSEAILELNSMYNPGIGSNNWAVHKQHTKNGNAILANDPHLGLSLPNVWYVMQLSIPELDVMGATFPGAPGILSGFNNYIAWGETNGEDDVSDFYDIKLDPKNSNNYIYDGESIPFEKREEKILIRGHALQFPSDTTFIVKSTKHGPIIIESDSDPLSRHSKGLSAIYSDTNLAFRWLAHDPTKEIKAFYQLNHAKDYTTFLNALSDFDCPCQNFVYADVSGNIGMYHRGKLPIRCESNGKGILPGHQSEYLWEYSDSEDFIPSDHLPKVKNPDKGYISSANQYPAPEDYPYYLPGIYWPSHRANRISTLLDTITLKGNVNINDMQKIQNDSYNNFAESVLDMLLNSIENKISNEEEILFFNALERWNKKHYADMVEPIIFDQWYENINNAVWEDLFINHKDFKTLPSHLYPLYDVLEQLIINEESSSNWFGDSLIIHSIIWKTFQETIKELKENKKLKNKAFSEWKYSDFRGTDIHHIISSPNFDAFSQLNIPTGGSRWSPNAMQKNFGPSWRYIVELKKDSVHAIGIYPGGQSGDPGSQFYDNYIDSWNKGNYLDLNFTYYDNKENLKGRRVSFYNE